MTQIPIILLAAGQSSRMGGVDKLLQPIDGVPLLRRSAQRAMAVAPVIVALPPKPHPRYSALDGLDLIKTEVKNASEGMNASLRRAMECVPDTAQAVMVLLADLPDLTSNDLNSVMMARDDHPENLIWRGATQTGKPGHPVIFDRALFAELSNLSGDEGAKPVVRKHQHKVHTQYLPDRNALMDLDTPEDWAAWSSSKS